ncbi:MAG: VWA domain-containing protein [Candidatus Bathyarchaeia archaeon]
MKPECRLCEEDETLSSILGRETVESLLYGMFNPESMRSKGEQKFDIDAMIKDYVRQMGDSDEPSYRYAGWTRRYLEWHKKLQKAREKAWEEILEKIMRGEIKPSDLPLDQMVKHFSERMGEELKKEGLLDLVMERYGHQQAYMYYALTAKSEKVIAQKVLEEAFAHLQKFGTGLHEIAKTGFGIYPSHIIREYDEFLHTYDMLDVQETLISTALRDPQGMDFLRSDLKARIPLHKAKSSNAIVIDKSGSMNGYKLKGAVMAALGLRELLETEYKEDTLHVIAYDHRPYILSPGDIVRLVAHSWTDIGQAVDMTRKILSKEEGNRNLFLITDGEPTSSCYPDQTPEESALRATYMAGRDDIRMNIIMLDSRPGLRRFCEQMATLNGNATIAFVDDPLNLKEFVIKSYIQYRRVLANRP